MGRDSSILESRLTSETEEQVCRLLGGSRFAMMYGSGARGALRRDSDLDLAVLYESRLALSDLARLGGEIEKLTGRSTDIVDLLEAGPVLKMQIARYGRPIVVNDSGELARFLALTPSEYFDFKIERRAAEQAVISSLAP